MAEYISSFTTGFSKIANNALLLVLKGARVIDTYDGLIHYTYNGACSDIEKIHFFNNSFLVYKTFRGNSLDFKQLTHQFVFPKTFNGKNTPGSFRVRFSKENQFVKVDNSIVSRIEKEIIKVTHQQVDRVNPCTEYWFIIRRENVGFFGRLLKKRTFTEKNIQKGELRPEFAFLMCVFSGLNGGEVVCDPFAGHGAIPAQIIKYFHPKTVYINDNNPEMVKIIRNNPVFRRSKCCHLSQEDALSLASIKEHSLDIIITDPPWGIFEKIDNIQDFYLQMFDSFRRILKINGEMVVLSARKAELLAVVDSIKNLFVVDQIDTLVNGKKAGLYRIKIAG